MNGKANLFYAIAAGRISLDQFGMAIDAMLNNAAIEARAALSAPTSMSAEPDGYAFRSDGKLWVTQSLAVAERWKTQGFEITPVRSMSAENRPAQDDVRFLVIAMDDDQRGHPTFCADEKAVEQAVRECTFMDGIELDADELEQVRSNTAALLEEGHLSFEGDPGIHLYRLPEGFAAIASAKEPK